MTTTKTRLGKGGRVVIPAQFRKAQGLNEGDHLLLIVEDGSLRLLTVAQAIKEAQALVRKLNPKGRRLSEELLAERRAEAARE
ncbi:MAG: AbrB/MazE/SpoVT family DNA-binding domain-containing protein [Dehalococcoidia bacterium]|nr:AbrB/MazE/SpoVT family DNA-binding domain-containing protein [Dehalococcoidia bacterium]